MKSQAAVLYGEGQDFKVEEIEVDEPKENEVLVHIAGISVSLGAAKRPLRLLLGYNPEHVLIEEASHDAVAQSSGTEARGCRHRRRDGLALC